EVEVEGAMDRLKTRTTVEVSGNKLFTIAHVESDPKLAKDVVQAFLNIFVEGNLGQDRSDMDNAQSFIAKQLALYEKQLQEIEKRRADFEAKKCRCHISVEGVFLGAARESPHRRRAGYRRFGKRERARSSRGAYPEVIF